MKKVLKYVIGIMFYLGLLSLVLFVAIGLFWIFTLIEELVRIV